MNKDPSKIRGIRNNNPGNIVRQPGVRWQGMSDDQTLDDRFIVFKEPKWGIRAIARTLITYQDKRKAADGSKIDSVQEIIARWAPSSENNTNRYAAFVASKLGIAPNSETIDVYNYQEVKDLVEAIITYENGIQPYSDKMINAGLRLAGIDVPAKPLSKSRTVKASTATGIGVMLMSLLPQIDSVKELLGSSNVPLAQYLVMGLTLVSVGITVWVRIDDATTEERA